MLFKESDPYKHHGTTLIIDHDRNVVAPAAAAGEHAWNLAAEHPHLKPQILVVNELENTPISDPQTIINCKVPPPSVKPSYGTTAQVPHLPPPVSACQHDRNISVRKVRAEGQRHCLSATGKKNDLETCSGTKTT